jgi:hypothetical protein
MTAERTRWKKRFGCTAVKARKPPRSSRDYHRPDSSSSSHFSKRSEHRGWPLLRRQQQSCAVCRLAREYLKLVGRTIFFALSRRRRHSIRSIVRTYCLPFHEFERTE